MQHSTRAAATALALAVWALMPPAPPAQSLDHNLIGYYPSWAVYARDYHVPDIPGGKVNIINYAFAKIADGEIALGDPYADTGKWYPGDSWHPDSLRGSFHQLQILKRAQPHLRTLISVGGWTYSTYFSDVALTPQSRSIFAASCVEFVQRYGFDGVDIDWEYPVSGGHPGNIYRPEDRENYTLLLAELRAQLDASGDYLLTTAGPASPFVIPNLEIDLIHPHLDWINIMTYDSHGPWNGEFDQVTNFNAALYPAPEDPNPEPAHSGFNLAAAVEAYLGWGVPPEQLNPGLAFYGRGYGMVVNQHDGLFVGYEGPAGSGTWEPGVFDFWDLRAHYIYISGYTSHWHAEAQVPWVFNPTERVMISYDDPASIALKGAFIADRNLGGAMFWEFSADREAELLDAIHAALGGGTTDVAEGNANRPPQMTSILLSLTPNPARHRVQIVYDVPSPQKVRLRMHTVGGQLVHAWPARMHLAGRQSGWWDGCDVTGRRVPSGVYFLEVAGVTFTGSGSILWIAP